MFDVICYGIVCLDYIWRTPRLPPPGGYVGIAEERTLIGGEAANTALALRLWGASVHLSGPTLGADERGRLLLELLGEAFPDPDSVVLSVDPSRETPYCTCIATEDGHRTMFGRGFDAMACSPLDPDLAAAARFFTIDSAGHLEEGKRAVGIAAESGACVVAMDCSGVPEICEKADALLVGGEGLAFRGVENTESAMLGWAKRMRDRYGATVIVTRGAEGCVAADRDGTELAVPAFPVEMVVDSTGSGDVFRAGYLFGRLQGWDLLKTLRFGSAAAAMNCGAMGAWTGVKDLESTLAFLSERTANASNRERV